MANPSVEGGLPVHSRDVCPWPSCATHLRPQFADQKAPTASAIIRALARKRASLPLTHPDGSPRWPNGHRGQRRHHA